MGIEGSFSDHCPSFWRRRHDMSNSDGPLCSLTFEVLAFDFGVLIRNHACLSWAF